MTTTLAEAVTKARADIAAMSQVLAQLEVVSHGRTTSLDGSTSSSRDRSPILRVDEEPYPHDLYRAKWDEASTAVKRAEVLADARATLERVRKAPPPPVGLLERGSHHWWLRIAEDFETPIGELARLHEVSRQAITRWRRRYGLTPPVTER
jgi:hypothetical protein